MISIPNKNSLIKVLVSFFLYCSITVNAQNEIPDNIKEYLVKGVESLESSKTPSDIENSYDLFSKAAELAPDFPDVHYFLGKTLSLMQGNTERAIKELKLYLQLYPDAPDKEKVTSEISELEKLVTSKKYSYLMGISLVELTDGIYVYRVSPNYPPFGRRGVPIKSGDKIVEVNNIDVSKYSLKDIMEIFEADSLEIEKPRKIKVIRGEQELNLDMYKRKKDFDPRIKDIGEQDLKEVIQNSVKPMVVFFVSDWCKDCQKYFDDRTIQNPTYAYRNEISFVYVNIDEHSTLAEEYGIKKSPVIQIYKQGKLFDVINGYDRDLFIEKVEDLIK